MIFFRKRIAKSIKKKKGNEKGQKEVEKLRFQKDALKRVENN